MPIHTFIEPGSVRSVRIRTGTTLIDGDLVLPERPHGIVLFAHGTGSSRFSRRNRWVAGKLQQGGFVTLLVDLLTREEESIDATSGTHRFDIGLLARRLVDVADWLGREPETRAYPLGLFGASTGAAAALMVAAERPEHVRAVVSRGGRPDLAGLALRGVRAPTLLIVGGNDAELLRLNRQAKQALPATSELRVVEGASHLFEEPGALDAVAALTVRWFDTHLERSLQESDALRVW